MAKEVGGAGDIVKILTSDSEYSGTVIPSPDEKIVLLKLSSGYNVGIEKSKIKKIFKTGSKKEAKFPEAKVRQNITKEVMIVKGMARSLPKKLGDNP